MFVGIGLVTIPLTMLLYVTINKRRAKIIEELGGFEGLRKKYSAKELSNARRSILRKTTTGDGGLEVSIPDSEFQSIYSTATRTK